MPLPPRGLNDVSRRCHALGNRSPGKELIILRQLPETNRGQTGDRGHSLPLLLSSSITSGRFDPQQVTHRAQTLLYWGIQDFQVKKPAIRRPGMKSHLPNSLANQITFPFTFTLSIGTSKASYFRLSLMIRTLSASI
jgi:hypothetical protein